MTLRYRLRAELRTRWKAWLGLAIAIGLAGGIALAAAAGARRTASAYPRLLDSVEEADAFAAPSSPDGRYNDPNNPVLDAIEQLPQVERAGRFAQLTTFAGNRLDQIDNAGMGSLGLVDGNGYALSRPKLVDGRMPDPRRLDEALANPLMAEQRHLHVGSRVRVLTLSSDAVDAAAANHSPYDGPVTRNTLTITGIGRFARDVVPTTTNDEQPLLYVTPAFFAQHPEALVNYGSVVRLRPGADVDAYRADVIRVAGQFGVPSTGVFFTTQRDRSETVARAVRPQALALALLAAVVALAAFLVAGQMLSRQVFVDAGDSPVLGAIGMTRRQRFVLALSRVAIVSATGAAIAVAVAIAASPLFPAGVARDAEPHAGFSVDAVALAAGFGILAVGFLARGTFPAWRGATASAMLSAAEPGAASPSRVAEALGRAGLRAAPVIGVRMAFEPGRGRTAVPVRSALVTTALAIASVAAVFTFTTNLDRLAETPDRYGWGWTAVTGFGFDPEPGAVTKRLVADPRTAGVAGGNLVDLEVAGHTVTAATFERLKGTVGPVILEGRPPQGGDELVLGTRTLHAAGYSIGDRIPVKIEERAGTMKIVGRAVFPRLGAGAFTPTDLGEGAALTNTAARKLAGAEAVGGNPSSPVDPNDPDALYSIYFLRAAAGVSFHQLSSSVNRSLTGIVDGCPSPACVSGPQRPGDIIAYRRVRSTTTVLVVLLALMAVATLTHSLVTSVRRRRRDVAVLKTLGFVGRQVSSAARWQGLALSASALLVGIPLGLVSGRVFWSLFADTLGVANDSSIPIGAVLLAVPVTLAIAALVSTIPASVARRTRPASVLRSL